MIEEQIDLKDRTIPLGNSPLRDRTYRTLEVLPPSPSSNKEIGDGKGSSDYSSRQGLGSKKSDINFVGENVNVLNVINVFEDSEKSLSKADIDRKGKKIKKAQTLKKCTRRQILIDRQEHSRTVDIGIQTKSKGNSKSQTKDEYCVKEEYGSQQSSKQRPHQYSIKSYQEKLKIVKCAYIKGAHFASRKYNVSINNIHRWKVSCKRRPGAGRKINDPAMQICLIQWIKTYQQQFGAIPQRKDIREKAIKLSSTPGFQASKGWYQRFLDRNSEFRDLPRLKLKRTVSQIDIQQQQVSSLCSNNQLSSSNNSQSCSIPSHIDTIYIPDQVKMQQEGSPYLITLKMKIEPSLENQAFSVLSSSTALKN